MQDIKQCEKAISDFELVNAEDFTWLDLKFYNKVSNDFKLEGFSLIGDVEFICFNDFYLVLCQMLLFCILCNPILR